ncbi:MAG: protein kinase [Oscillospiraceae bacterium]|nr:protein kinase [Oscillospiraceae bacterium]
MPNIQNIEIPVISNRRYRITEQLGAGGGGAVFKAWDFNLQKWVVIKTLFNAEGSSQERDALKNVKSEFLPQVYDFLNENGQFYTVMEFIEGQSLDKLLRNGVTFTQAQVVKWYGQLASAVEVLHKNNICHRDIKPGNIMLLPNGDVCLIDFNAALVSGNDVQLISRSLGYCSPEQYAIYEKYKSLLAAPIRYEHSDRHIKGVDPNVTERVDNETTELVDNGATTELVDDATSPFDDYRPIDDTKIDWRLSDIYSLGATMYHLLSGVHPPVVPSAIEPLSKLGRYSEGIVYIIEQSLKENPLERISSAKALKEAVANIHKHDVRWRIARSKRIAAAIILPVLFVIFTATTVAGYEVMAQEKEEKYYTVVREIATAEDPYEPYDTALSLYWDRIDPYLAMAERLWEDGDITTCREYIEDNLGNIAEFQSVEEYQHSFGDIYYILANCYYYQTGDPDYATARDYFAIATQYVTDNATYYRDYAVCLARTGYVEKAEEVIGIAEDLGLDEVSLSFTSAEIAFAEQDYDLAVELFKEVISESSDQYLLYRAYRTTDEIYKLEGKAGLSVELLTESLKRIPLSCVNEMKERLADAYVSVGAYEGAISVFEDLNESVSSQFHIMQNLAILYQTVGNFNKAMAMLEEMSELFPTDYRVPMRMAFVEADMQSELENEERDYTKTKEYYEQAKELYEANLTTETIDTDMQQLESLIAQLEANGWFE